MIYDAGPALGRTVIANELHDQNRNLASKGFRRDFLFIFLFGVISPVGAGRVQMPTNAEQEGIDKAVKPWPIIAGHHRAQLLKC